MDVCPLCGFKDIKIYCLLANNLFKTCPNCSLVFLNKKNISSEKNNLYTRDYITKRGHDNPDSYIGKIKRITINHYLFFLERYISKGNLLEIGCSTGIALSAARERGWKVYGIEINEAAVSVAKNLLALDSIRTGYLNEKMFPDDFFSMVLMMDVLEHILNPQEVIKILENKIKRSGLIFIVTPNIKTISAKILIRKWPHLFPEHVYLYSPKSIKFLFNNSRFKILKIGWAIKFVNLDILKYHLECHPDILFSQFILTFLNKLTILNKVIFPFNIDEMFVLAQKQ